MSTLPLSPVPPAPTPQSAPARIEPNRKPSSAPSTASPRWVLSGLAGRLGELSGSGASAQLSLAFSLVLDAQERGEPVAWVTTQSSTFFPPDAAANGVDLDALPVVFAPDAALAARSAERLARSGAFGLIVLDLVSERPEVPSALQSRLTGLARRHDMAVLCLTAKSSDAASLGALVSLRCQALRSEEERCYRAQIEVLKDKSHGPGWTHSEVFDGPGGLR